MPQRREPARLEQLCLKAVGSFVADVGRRLVSPVCTVTIADPTCGIRTLQANVRWLNSLLSSSVPCYLYDHMAQQVLNAVQQLIERTKKTYDQHSPMSIFINEMNVVVSLTESVINARLRSVDFTMWPKMMRYVLYKSLDHMTGLRVLNLGSCLGGWRDYDHLILDGLACMSHLHTLCLCFDCTDIIIQALGENCPKLQRLDVTSSRSVTDRSVPALLKCPSLRELQLHRTSVTVAGFAHLILGLPELQDLGRCDELGNALQLLYQQNSKVGPLGLRKFQSRDVTTDHLKLLVDLCPEVYHVSLFHDEFISDMMVLSMLDCLTELKLLSCSFYTDNVKQLLEMKGFNLTSLHLEHVEEVDLNALVYISRYCPRLQNLVLYNCDFLSHASLLDNSVRLSIPRFQCLERVFCVADCATLHLEFLLTHCINIKFIHLGSSTGVGHNLMTHILSINPMRHLEELRILYSSDLSIRTVRMLLDSCPCLRVLSELESWNGISVDELKFFREYIEHNNFDLDIRPTLSY